MQRLAPRMVVRKGGRRSEKEERMVVIGGKQATIWQRACQGVIFNGLWLIFSRTGRQSTFYQEIL